MVGGDKRLPRPLAADAGLVAATGDWLCFLDDDDTYDPTFVSAMVQAAGSHPDALLIYGPARNLDQHGAVEREFGMPFNRALMHYGPLFYWQSALIRRRVVALGCRFDPDFDVCEDRDFLAQIAEHGDFVFVPIVGFNYLPHLGTSGTAGANRDVARTIRYDSLLRAKWAGPGLYHTCRATWLCQRAIAAYHAGDHEGARLGFSALLAIYPGDPNGLHGLGRLFLDEGRLNSAEDVVRKALAVNPTAAEYLLTLATVLMRSARPLEAVRLAERACGDPLFRAQAEALLRELADLLPHAVPAGPPPAGGVRETTRLGPCRCGSGKRFKHCCGRHSELGRDPPAHRVVRDALGLFGQDEAVRAEALLDGVMPKDVDDAVLARRVGEVFLAFAQWERAYAFLEWSSRLRPTTETGRLLSECCDSLWRNRARISAYRMAHRLQHRIVGGAGAAAGGAPGPIHILANLARTDAAAAQALGLYRLFAPHGDIRLWTTREPAAAVPDGPPADAKPVRVNRFPNGGTLMLVGLDGAGDWLGGAAFDRVIIWIDRDEPAKLIALMAQLEMAQRIGNLEFTFPAERYRELANLPGEVVYPLLAPSPPAPTRRHHAAGSLVLAVLAGEGSDPHHPTTTDLCRAVGRRGHLVRLVEGTGIGTAGGPAAEQSRAGVGSAGDKAGDVLAEVDCLVFRPHPAKLDVCGRTMLEGMARGLPVVVFGQNVCNAELIEHSLDGLLVETEEEALACIDQLASDRDYRLRIGQAGRNKALRLTAQQSEILVNEYVAASTV